MRFALDQSWTVEAWVRLDADEADGGTMISRAVGDALTERGIEVDLSIFQKDKEVR